MYGIGDGIVDTIPKHVCQPNSPIRILYIGQIGWLNNVYKFVDAIGNDDRYEMIFAGTGSEKVLEYAKKKNIQNIECIGRFKPDQTTQLLKKGDIIYNLYGNDNLHLTLAISLKFYYALYMGVPILVFKGTEMEKVSKQSGIGYVVNDFDCLADDFYRWYSDFYTSIILEKRERFFREIDNTRDYIYNQINNVFEINNDENE